MRDIKINLICVVTQITIIFLVGIVREHFREITTDTMGMMCQGSGPV